MKVRVREEESRGETGWMGVVETEQLSMRCFVVESLILAQDERWRRA